MGHLVDHGDPDLLDHLVLGAAVGADGQAEDRDLVGHGHAEPVGVAPLGERHAHVPPEQAPAGSAVLDHDHDVVDQPGQLVGDAVERVAHQGVEPVRRHVDHGRDGTRPNTVSPVADPLLHDLDEAQRRAVTSPARPLAILAPAGSGKTRVLTRRIAWRVETGDADASHVLALTFTRRAAGELAARLRALGLRGGVATGTFHAVAFAQLRARWADEGRAAPALLTRKSRLLSPLVSGTPLSAAQLAGEIEWAKARLVGAEAYPGAAAAARRRVPVPAARVAELYAAYEDAKRKARMVDFDDLLALCSHTIETDPAFAALQRWRFQHLFVDEFQDVNPLQLRLLDAWRGRSEEHK